MAESLNGKVAVITGSTRGLGWAIARAFADQGALVVINGRSPAALTIRAAATVAFSTRSGRSSSPKLTKR